MIALFISAPYQEYDMEIVVIAVLLGVFWKPGSAILGAILSLCGALIRFLIVAAIVLAILNAVTQT